MTEQNRTVYVEALGCTTGRLDANTYRRYFRANGYRLVEDAADADVVVFTTCGVVEQWATISIARFRELRKTVKPSAQVLVGGCLPGIDPVKVHEVFDGVTFTPSEAHVLEDVCPGDIPLEQISCTTVPNDAPVLGQVPQKIQAAINACAARHIPVPSHLHRCFGETENASMCYVRISSGCLDQCAFCAIRHARGTLRSRAPELVVRDFEQGLKDGYNRFVLVGEDTGCYGHDIGSDLPTLLKQLIAVGGDRDYRLLLRDISPRWLVEHLDGLLEVIRTGHISALQIPVQSGSNRTLERMKRHNTVEDVEAAVRRIRQADPDIVLKTLVLLGFPGETEEDFRETLAFIRRGYFDEVFPMAYSDRPNTEASTMDGKLPKPVVVYRIARATVTILHHVYLNRFHWFPLEVPGYENFRRARPRG